MKKRRFLLVLVSFIMMLSVITLNLSAALNDGTDVIIKSGGSFESAYVEWHDVNNATGYNVYYKLSSSSTYVKIDSNLIRKYPSNWRADIVGLQKGVYDIKVVPIFNDIEGSSAYSTTVTVLSHVREGFAFTKTTTSLLNPGCGGYNNDGTIPNDAQILYISKNTINSVSLDVITNSKGTKTKCAGLSSILAARKKGFDNAPLIIRFSGTINFSDIKGLNSNGYLEIKGCSNITIEGIGEDATAYGWGILVRSATNIEIRNLGLMLFPDDGISIDTDNKNIWVHNNDIFYGKAGKDADQVKGDGSCDVKKSNYITISFNHFWDSGKALLCGLSESSEFFISYHHNWFDHSDSRHPRVRTGSIHVYNNYYDGVSKYGVGATKGSSIFVEANYFRNCKYPMLISLQGSDIYNTGLYDGVGSFSKEEGGMIKAYNNIIIGATRFVDQISNPTQFDAITVASRNEKILANYKTVSGGKNYNNFDTNSDVIYSYLPDNPEQVPVIVEKYAGRLNGGDFKWNFDDNIHDKNDGIISDLMQKLEGY